MGAHLRWRFSSLSIQQKLGLLVLLPGGVALLVSMIGVGALESRALTRAFIQRATVQTCILADNCRAALEFDDRQGALEILVSLRSDESVIGAYLLDANERILAEFHTRPSLRVPVDQLRPVREPLETEGALVLSAPVRFAGQVRGYALVIYDLSFQRARLRTYLLAATAILLASTALAYVLSMLLRRSVTAPLAHLAEVAETVSAKRLYSVRAMAHSDDELGKLVKTFNHMLQQIESRDAALQSAHDELESRVEARTRDLLRAKEEAEAATRTKSEFLANVSHELRTPMHAILSFASFGTSRFADASRDKLRGYFERIHESGERLLTLLNDLLDLSKLEAGRIEFHMAPENLNALLKSGIDEFESLLSERSLRVEYTGGVAVIVLADRERLLQVFRNLLSNAVKFAPPGSTIHVLLQRRDHDVLVTVRDHGVGVPEDELEVIFEKFVQSRNTKTGAGGTGLGLAICRQIITAHGGRIWASNNPDGGASLMLTLPLQNTMALRPSRRQAAEVTAHG